MRNEPGAHQREPFDRQDLEETQSELDPNGVPGDASNAHTGHDRLLDGLVAARDDGDSRRKRSAAEEVLEQGTGPGPVLAGNERLGGKIADVQRLASNQPV